MRASLVIGVLVLVLVRLRISLMILLHYARHPASLKLREEGVVSFSKHSKVTPYGFRCPVRWTSDELPTCTACKHDAAPVHVVELLTRHHWLTGERMGTSLFIDGSDKRRERKYVYMQGLTEGAIEEYKAHMREMSPFRVTCKSDALLVASRLTANGLFR